MWPFVRSFAWILSNVVKPKPLDATPIVPLPPSNGKRIVIFGATGGSGSAALKFGLEQGYNVIAAVRRPSAVTVEHERLKVVQTDLTNEKSIEDAIRGSDLVLSCLGNPFSNGTYVTECMNNIMRAMKKEGVNRLVSLSSNGLYENAEFPYFFEYIMKRRIFKNIYADLALMEVKLREQSSWLNWTVIRPGGFFEGPQTGKYRFNSESHVANGLFQSVADVAHSLFAFSSDQYIHQTICISY